MLAYDNSTGIERNHKLILIKRLEQTSKDIFIHQLPTLSLST